MRRQDELLPVGRRCLARREGDPASIGLVLCKEKNKVVAEYALRDTKKPIGVSAYRLLEKLPAKLKGSLPTVEELEAELGGKDEAPRRVSRCRAGACRARDGHSGAEGRRLARKQKKSLADASVTGHVSCNVTDEGKYAPEPDDPMNVVPSALGLLALVDDNRTVREILAIANVNAAVGTALFERLTEEGIVALI
jgi:YhcG PDDEXK nuclease domain